MDVEKIMKINEMTKTLKEHGMVDDPSKNAQADKELRGGHGVTPENNSNEVPTNPGITKDQLDIALERNTRRIMEFIDSLKDEIDALKKKVAELEARPAQVIEKQVVQSTPHEPVVKEASQPAVQEQPAATAQNNNHARGDPKEMQEDVSIEKMFYYGKK